MQQRQTGQTVVDSGGLQEQVPTGLFGGKLYSETSEQS